MTQELHNYYLNKKEEKLENTTSWTICQECKDRAKKAEESIRKSDSSTKAVEQFEKSNGESPAPVRPKAHLDSCSNCSGSGLILLQVLP
jgi:hypothetical protein